MIRFTRKDGYCPYFKYGKEKYFIQDYVISYETNPWTYNYSFKVEKLEEPQIIKFKDFNNAKDYVENLLKDRRYQVVRCHADNSIGYDTGEFLYGIVNNVLRIIEKSNVIASNFSNYADCLKYAKEYLRKKIDKESGRQLRLPI